VAKLSAVRGTPNETDTITDHQPQVNL